MRVQQCPYCEHSNPVEAKFCNDCGSPLHLKPCPACATLAEARAEACASCGAAFPDRPILTVHPLDDPVDADDEPIVLTERIDLQDPVGLNDPIELPEPVGPGDPIDLGDPIGLADPTEPATVSADSGPGVPHVSLFDRIAERGLRSASVAPPVPPGAQAQPVPSTSGPIETPVPVEPAHATPAHATPVSELPAAAPVQPDASDESVTHPGAGPPAAAPAAPGRRRARFAWIAFVLVAAALAALLVNRDRAARDPNAAPHGASATRVDAPAHDASIAQPAGSAEPAPAAAAPAAKATSAFPAKAPAASPAASPAVAPAATAGAPAVAPAAAAGPTAPPTSPATAVAPTLRARGPEPATASPTAAGRIDCTRAVAALGLCDTPLPKEDE